MRRANILPTYIDTCVDCKRRGTRNDASYLCQGCYEKRLKNSFSNEIKRMGERKV